MDVAKLAERAQTGDVDAFTELVRRYQAMAFGYAFATLRDTDLAEDAAQQAFITAWRTMRQLRDPARVGGWLRGIVRFECLHLMRRRSELPLDRAVTLASIDPGPDEIAERHASDDTILSAIDALPEHERVPVVLYYIHDRSQKDVAEFLNLPVSTINNRLRSARKHLREGGFFPMPATTHHTLPSDFADRIGAVIRARGPIVDARFKQDQRPPVLNQVSVTDDVTGLAMTAQVAQYLDDNLVRCIVLGDTTGPVQAGASVRDLAAPVEIPLSGPTIATVVESLNRAGDSRPALETGIKAIDLFAPLPVGGVVALTGDMQVGKMVLVEELIHRIGTLSPPVRLLVFVETETEVKHLQQLDYRTSPGVEAIYLPVRDASPEALGSILDQVDAVITLNRDLGRQKLYPAIDPVRTTSRASDNEATAVTGRLRALLRDEPGSARAILAQRYLTQPFYVAEPFTNRPGVSVPVATAASDLQAILEGACDAMDPETLTWIGALP